MEEAALVWNSQKADPLYFPKRILDLKTLWWGAEKIIASIFSHHKVAVPSGHSMSKDWAAGIIALHWLLRYWGNAKVIVTAPTGRQVKEVMFGEIKKQYSNLRERFPEFDPNAITSNKLTFGNECFALGFTTKDTSEMVGKFHGFKSTNMLVIISEAQAVSPSVYKQIKGILTSENARILELGNPLMPFGDFFEHCTNKKFGYKVIPLSCLQSPNVVQNREVIPGMVTTRFIKEFQEEIGPGYEDDPEYQSRVLGEFPQQSAYAWIPLSKIRAAVGRKFVDDDIVKVSGLDTAREGPDETVHTVFKGRTLTKQDCFKKALVDKTIGWVKGLVVDEKVELVAMDEGYTPGVMDVLRAEDVTFPIIGIKFGESSPNERFGNFGTYIWWLLKKAFMEDNISIPDDLTLIYQLASRRIDRDMRGKVVLESKKKHKKGGKTSPDRGDSAALAWYARLMIVGGLESVYDADFNTEASVLQEQIEKSDEGLKLVRGSEDDDNDIASIEMDSSHLEI